MAKNRKDKIIIAISVLATILLAGSYTAPVVATHVTPTLELGNPSCSDIEPGWIELKVEPGANGFFTDNTLRVTIGNFDGTNFDWSSNIGVDGVIVKGGPDANLYLYDPPAEATSDTGLHPPFFNTQPFGLSHISFCYDGNGVQVGGEILPIDMTSLFVAGALTNALWILPLMGGIVGAVIAVTRARTRKATQ